MNHPVIRKLEFFGRLPDEDRMLVEAAISREKAVAARTDLIREGDDPTVVHLVTDGFACRYKHVAGGRRQIVALLIPGDFVDPYAFVLNKMDHCISTLVASKIASISRTSMLEMMGRPVLARALLMAALADSATLREWVATLGRRSSELRIAHLFCEVTARLRAVGLISQQGVVCFPLTQADLSDTVGLSIVHTNRSLQSLRTKGYVKFSSNNLELLDTQRLAELCGFTPNYLHLTP